MTATAIKNAIVVLTTQKIGGQTVIETGCEDFDAYKALPAVVQYDGEVLGKTGWNSDRQIACYKTRVRVAYGR